MKVNLYSYRTMNCHFYSAQYRENGEIEPMLKMTILSLNTKDIQFGGLPRLPIGEEDSTRTGE